MITRRRFIQSSVSLALVPLLPRLALSASVRVRPSWEVFCTGPMFQPFCDALRLMRANKNNADPNAWGFWTEAHRQFCPHGVAYFLAWHRGFLYRFEGRVRKLSGQPDLVLPYWNYYDTPSIPPEFLDSSLPLYRSDRTGGEVSGALSLDPFADTIIRFQRGKPDAFEAVVESRPHNRVHNLIGGSMASILTSPRDPLFWMHHANIDRLWAAWIKAGNGRHQPAASNIYWSGEFQYGTGIKAIPRVWTTTTTANLGYQYDNETLPSSVQPPPPSSSPPPPSSTALFSGFSLAGAVPSKPASIVGAPLGSSRALTLDERSVSVEVPLNPQATNRVRSLMLAPASQAADMEETGSIRVVLDGVRLTGLGQKGGYYYDVYLNLPDRAGVSRPERTYLLGTLGAFEITVAQMKAGMKGSGMQTMAGMHGSGHDADARLVFPATDALRRLWPNELDRLSVSFVRVDGNRRPGKGDVITIKAFSVEADGVK